MEDTFTPNLSVSNFVIDELELGDGYLPIFLHLSKADVYDKDTATLSFTRLRAHQKTLVKLFSYMTHCFNGEILLCYMEPELVVNQHELLTPPLRCSLSSGVTLVFLLRKDMLSGGGEGRAFGLIMDAAELGGDHTHLGVKPPLVGCVKRLILYAMGVISRSILYTKAGDEGGTLSDAMDQINWETGRHVQDVCRKTVTRYGGKLFLDFRTLSSDAPETFTIDTFTHCANQYFFTEVDRWGSFADSFYRDPDFIIWSLMKKFLNPVDHPGLRNSPDCASYRFLVDLAGRSDDGGVVDTSKLLLFRYRVEDFFDMYNFNKSTNVPLYCYPFVDAGVTAARLKTLRDFASFAIKNSRASGSMMNTSKQFAFRTLFPQLGDIWHILKELGAESRDPTAGPPPLIGLKLRLELFRNITLRNSSKIIMEPARTIFSRAQATLERMASPIVAFTTSTNRRFYVKATDPTSAVRSMERDLFSVLFRDHFNLTRMHQATVCFSYIIHNSAPRWSHTKTMLINFTKPGQGKTHTNNVLKLLFGRIDTLFEEITTFTTTAFKYGSVQSCKILLLDDVGFNSGQQKSMLSEDSAITGQFKCMLDNGYTVNEVTEFDKVRQKNSTSRIVAVLNNGFIWNVNTLSSFTNAWQDRCLIMGMESVGRVSFVNRGTQLAEVVSHNHLDAIVEKMLLRQNLLQTMLYMMTPHGNPGAEHNQLIDEVIGQLTLRFPTFHGNDSKSASREHFKIMDMAIGEALTLAIMELFELWVPPWAPVPAIEPGETVRGYMDRVEAVRIPAMALMSWPEIIVETAVRFRLLLPSAITQASAAVFRQDASAVIHHVAAFFWKLVSSGEKLEQASFENGVGTVVEPFSVDPNCSMGYFQQACKLHLSIGGTTRSLILRFKNRTESGGFEFTFDAETALAVMQSTKTEVFNGLWASVRGSFLEQVSDGLFPGHVSFKPSGGKQHSLLTLMTKAKGYDGIYRMHDCFQIANNFRGIMTECLRHTLAEMVADSLPPVVPAAYQPLSRLSLDHHHFTTPETWSEDETEGTAVFMAGSYQPSPINRMDGNYMSSIDLSGHFSHCPTVLYASGCQVSVNSWEAAPGWLGPEYADAGKIYEKYFPGSFPPSRVRGEVGRILCFATELDAAAADDPMLAGLYLAPQGTPADLFTARYGVKSAARLGVKRSAAPPTPPSTPKRQSPPKPVMELSTDVCMALLTQLNEL